MILPQKNAKLVAVSRGGASEDFGDPEDDGAAVWSGEVDAYLGRRRASLTEANELSVSFVQFVIVPGDVLDFQVGDRLTLKRRGATIRVKVREFPDPVDEAIIRPIRLELETR